MGAGPGPLDRFLIFPTGGYLRFVRIHLLCSACCRSCEFVKRSPSLMILKPLWFVSEFWVHVFMALLAQAHEIALCKRQFRRVLQMFHVMNRDCFSVPPHRPAALTLAVISLEDLRPHLPPLPRVIECVPPSIGLVRYRSYPLAYLLLVFGVLLHRSNKNGGSFDPPRVFIYRLYTLLRLC